MRKWLFEETGEERLVEENDYFINRLDRIEQWGLSYPSTGKYPILKVTELFDDEKTHEECHGKNVHSERCSPSIE